MERERGWGYERRVGENVIVGKEQEGEIEWGKCEGEGERRKDMKRGREEEGYEERGREEEGYEEL